MLIRLTGHNGKVIFIESSNVDVIESAQYEDTAVTAIATKTHMMVVNEAPEEVARLVNEANGFNLN